MILVARRHRLQFRSAEFLGESDEKPFRAANVAQPIRVFILDYFADELRAGRAWATLMINDRGSTGYGQAFADASSKIRLARGEAIRRNLWINRDRIGVEAVSYGGQRSAWLITKIDSQLFQSQLSSISLVITTPRTTTSTSR